MNKIIGLIFTLVYIVLAYFLMIMSIHGPRLFPYFELDFLVVALGVLWWLCFFVPRRKPGHLSLVLTLCGLAIGALLILVSYASWGRLVDWEVYLDQKRAAATEVLNMQDQPLLLQGRAPIGIRLKYSIRFPDSDYYWQSPSVYPQTDIGYFMAWSIIHETIEPPMQIVSSGVEVPTETAHLPPIGRRYEQGKLYNFTVDLVPDFLALSADRTRVCIVRLPVTLPARDVAAQKKLLSTDHIVYYKVAVSGTDYTGPTQRPYNLKTFYDAAIKEGASVCKYRDGRISFK